MILDIAAAGFLGFLLYIVPGLVVLSLFQKGRDLTWDMALGLAPGLSLSLYPLLFLAFRMLGIAPGRVVPWSLIGLSVAALAARKFLPPTPAPPPGSQETPLRWDPGAGWALILLLILLFGLRLYVVRGMAAPAWGDSVQHAMIVRLFLDHGGLFTDWAPYAPFSTFTYHYGFHSAAAAWAWMSGADTARAVLAAGQVMNFLAVLAVYPLAVRWAGRRWSGIGAILAGGLLSVMPAFYTNWGRYTQLYGMVLLPTTIYFLDVWWKRPGRRDYGALALMGILLSALHLSHYRVSVLAAAAIVTWALRGLWIHRHVLKEWIFRVTLSGFTAAASILTVVPWLRSVKTANPSGFVSQAFSLQRVSMANDFQVWKHIDFYLGDVTWLAALAALGVALWIKRSLALDLLFWAAAVFIVTNPDLLGLPGAGYVSNILVMISLYIPISILLGWAAGTLLGGLKAWRPGRILRAGGLAVLLIAGVRTQLRVIDPFFQMVTPADLSAFSWIRRKAPPDALFLVNAFIVPNSISVVGSDAGWFLPLYTARRITLPPLLYFQEKLQPPLTPSSIVEFTRDVKNSMGAPSALREVLQRAGVTHVFLGEKRGRVGYETEELIPEAWLWTNRDFSLLYERGSAQIWRFKVPGP